MVAEEDFFFLPDFHAAEILKKPVKKETEALISECEHVSGVSVNRIVLAGERDIGRAFGFSSYLWPDNAGGKASLRDNEVPRRVVAAMFEFTVEVIERFQPDLILCGNGASPHYFSASLLAQKMGIPFIQGRQSKIHSKRSYWTTNRWMFNEMGHALYAEKRASQAEVSDDAKAFINRFRERPKTVDFILQNWKRGASRGWLSSHRGFIDLAIAHVAHWVRPGKRGVRPKPLLAKIREFYRSEYLKWRQRGQFSVMSEDELASTRYLYFPMHKEPEIALNYQAPFWQDQRNSVGRLSMVLPMGFKLLVREHRFNYGRRTSAYYRELAALPNVVVIHPLDPQFKYISNADLVVTENGSSGWEALLLKRPVVTLSNTLYDPPGLAHRMVDLEKMNAELLQLLETPPAEELGEAYEQRLGWLVDAEMESTGSDDEAGFDFGLQMIETICRKQKEGEE